MMKHFLITLFILLSVPVYAEGGTAGIVTGSGGTNIGGSQGVQTDEFTGAASYSYQIPVPPARGKIQPNILLNYNSFRKNPNSWVGYGWELNMGFIERVPEKELTNRIDYYAGRKFEARFGGQAETIKYKETIVALDGSFDLPLSGTVHADLYEPEIETGFNQYYHFRDVSDADQVEDLGWLIIDKGGNRYRFGENINSRLESHAEYAGVNDRHLVFQWFLAWVEDANGNRMNITYGGDKNPNWITYQDIRIQFVKSRSFFYYPAYRQALLAPDQQAMRLDEIIIYQDQGSSNERLQRFFFAYQPEPFQGVNELVSIRQYGKTDSSSLPATTFDYYQFDIERDGSILTGDLQWSDEGDGTAIRPGVRNDRTTFADMNGDGLTDKIGGNSDGTFTILFNNGWNFIDIGAQSHWSDPFDCRLNNSNHDGPCFGKLNASREGHQWLFLMDMNGDRLPDRVARTHEVGRSPETARFRIAFNKGDGWDPNTVEWRDPYQGGWAGTSDEDKGFADMNGDGLVDRVVGNRDAGGFQVYFNTGAGFRSTGEFWQDPLVVWDPNHDARGKISRSDGDKLYALIRDMNGDGLPDRVARGDLLSSSFEHETYGFTIFLNQNGKSWAIPERMDCGEGQNCISYNTIDVIAIGDQLQDEGQRGFFTNVKDYDWIDLNGDGYLDRIEGDRENSRFRVYFFRGVVDGGVRHSYLSPAYAIDDPLEEDQSRGYISNYDPSSRSLYGGISQEVLNGGGTAFHTFIGDLNGDGYPDRYSDNRFYPLLTNKISFSEDTSPYLNRSANQPLGALKEVSDGRGGRMAIEYLPTADGMRGPNGPVWPDPKHRFLPMDLYLVHKVYIPDASFSPTGDSPEAERYPGMRWTTYDYTGGNFFIRYAEKDDPGSLWGDEIVRPFESRFNGFQKVVKKVAQGVGDDFRNYLTETRFHQTKGDVDSVMDDEAARVLDETGYTHLALAGKPYRTLLAETTGPTPHLQASETSDWTINRPSDGENFLCEGICQPKLASTSRSIIETGDARERRSKVEYEYDDWGNARFERHYNSRDALILEIETTYHDPSSFNRWNIKDRPHFQYKRVSGTVYRKKEFLYDRRGNPTEERFFKDASDFVAVTRTFDSDHGNLLALTGTDGVTQTLGYDGSSLFPISESVTADSGMVLTTNRLFDRLTGNISKERGPSGVGTRTEIDDFGRPSMEYLIQSDGTEVWSRTYNHQFSTVSLGGIEQKLLKTTVYENQPEFGADDSIPAAISFSNASGDVLQSCSLTERGNYRLVQSRTRGGGRENLSTESVFSDNCDWRAEIPSGVLVTRSVKDLLERTVLIDPPDGEIDSPVEEVSVAYSTNGLGQLVKRSNFPDGRIKRETMDEFERLVNVESFNGNLSYSYNSIGDLTEVRDGSLLLTQINYDLMGLKEDMTDANLGTWQYHYLPNGELEWQMDNKGQKIIYQYDSLNRITRKDLLKADGTTESYETYNYDSGEDGFDILAGELYKVEEFSGDNTLLRRTRFGYDETYRRNDRISRFIPGVGEFEQRMSFDFRGNVTETTYPSGERVFYKYNRAGGLEKVCSEDSCSPESVYYSLGSDAYDNSGNLLREEFGNGVIAENSFFPESNRLQSRKIYKGDEIYSERTYTYDAYSNIKSIGDPRILPGSGSLTATYDSKNRLKTYTSTGAAALVMEYENSGNIKKNPASFGENEYQYTSSKPHAVTRIAEQDYSYDDNGNMTNDGFRTFIYNARNQLTRVTMNNGVIIDYEYDYTGTRVSKKVRREDPLHQIHETTTHFLGDAMEIRGNKLLLNISAGDQKIATKSVGTIAEATAPAGATLVDRGITPTIRIASITPHLFILFILFVLASFRPLPVRLPVWACRAPPVLRDIYEGWRFYVASLREGVACFPQRIPAKLLSLLLIFLFVVQAPTLAMADGAPPPETISDPNFLYYHHGDHLGSSHILTEGKPESRHSGVVYRKGQLLQRFEYTPFGQEKYVLNPNLKFDPSYTGQTYDIESGLYYYKSRYYNPTLGRFIQADTIVPDAKNLQAFNRYSYVNNNPLKFVDPTGHSWSLFRRFMGAFVSAFVASFLFVLLSVPLTPLGAYAVGMLAGSAVNGAITGGGAGAWSGFKGNFSWRSLFAGSIIYGAYSFVQSVRRDGWKSLVTFGLSVAGAIAGNVAGAATLNAAGGKGVGGPEGCTKCESPETVPPEDLPEIDYRKFFDGDEKISSEYGHRVIDGRQEFHGGADIRPKGKGYGTPFKAPRGGEITKFTMDGNGFYYRPDGFPQDAAYLLYHSKLSSSLPSLTSPIRVEAGTILGTIEQLGRTNGPHLHIQLEIGGKLYDPMHLSP